MKTLYVRVIAYNEYGYELEECNVYKNYPEYGVSIIKFNGYYFIVDTQTGLKASRRFNKLKDARLFMKHTKEANFINWYNLILRVRKNDSYKEKIIKENKL